MNYEKVTDAAAPVTLLLKGASGTGKTTKAAHFPKPAFFNFDNNLSGLRKLPAAVRDNIKIVNPLKDKSGKDVEPVKAWDNFVNQLEVVVEDKDVRTLIIDSGTTLAERLLDKVVGSADPAAKVQIQHWGDFQKYFKWLGDELLCNPSLDKNIIFIFHEQLKQDALTQNISYVLSISTKLQSSFELYFSDSWRTFVKTPLGKPTEYWVRCAPAPQFSAKNSLRDLPEEFQWESQAANILKQVK